MTHKAIVQIITLMSLSLLGIVGMQIYFILNTLKLNYEVFDSNVHAALDHTITRLEHAELELTATKYNLPKPTLANDEIIVAPSVVAIDEISTYMQYDSLLATRSDTISQDNYPKLEERFIARETRKTWKKGSNEAFRIHFERFFVHHGIIQSIPIEKRATLKMLNDILRQELQKTGINTAYVVAVFATQRDSFIRRESYCEHTNINLYNKREDFAYQIQLFPSGEQVQATLHIDFPHRKQFVWRSIFLHLIGTLLFAAIIVSSFYYTIRIIFNQKKVAEMKNDFLNNMTHEFKTPIATISLASDAIRSLLKNQKIDKIDRFVHIIKEENGRMLTQVEKVLQMARMEKKDLKLKIETIDVHTLASQAVATMSLQVEKREGRITTDFGATRVEIEADETHLLNAIINLLDNANKYSPESPKIHVVTRDAPNQKGILISVSDQGLGISKEAQKNVFAAFFRVSTGNLHDVKGFGLGLSYVKSITTAHGGDVSVQSESGKGSTFTIFMPYKCTVENEA
jgi:two-component system, OmpR family, phosphate regulon sensor histidine kinase PhoR